MIHGTPAQSRAAIHPFVRAMKPHWPEMETVIWAGRSWLGPNGLLVVITVDTINGAEWAHLSVSRRSRCPSYEDQVLVRRIFFGEDRAAYHVFPKLAEHRNLHSFCLHIWLPLGDDPFPDSLGERAETVAPEARR